MDYTDFRIAEARQKWNVDWNRALLGILDALVLIGDVLMLVSQTIIVALGVPLVLVLAVIVEQQRVWHGIELFEADTNLATLGSWVIVLINIVFEFQAHHIENKANFRQQEETEFSFRIVADQVLYVLGFGSKWQARTKSPAQRYYRLGRIVTLSILVLALAGSMKGHLARQAGPWYEGLSSIFTQSSLQDMITWVGGLLFAFAAVMSAQASSRYIAGRVVEIRNQMRYRRQVANHQVAPTPRRVASSNRATVSKGLQPIKVKIGDQTKYQCPICENVMSRQGWQKHPCRLTVATDQVDNPVDDLVDNPVDTLVDELTTMQLNGNGYLEKP